MRVGVWWLEGLLVMMQRREKLSDRYKKLVKMQLKQKITLQGLTQSKHLTLLYQMNKKQRI